MLGGGAEIEEAGCSEDEELAESGDEDFRDLFEIECEGEEVDDGKGLKCDGFGLEEKER